MKILLAAINGPQTLGGVETSIKNLARVLCEKGHNVALLTFDSNLQEGKYRFENGLIHYNYPVTRDRAGLLFIYRILKTSEEAVKEILKDFRPDQIWSRTIETTYVLKQSNLTSKIIHIPPGTVGIESREKWLNFSRFSLKKKLILRPLYSIQNLLYTRIQRKALLSDKVRIAVYCDMMRNRLQYESGVPAYKFCFTNPGTELPREPLSQGCREKLRNPYILYSGRLTLVKNVRMLIDVVKLLPEINLVIAGSGNQENELKEYTRSLQLEDRIIFLGHIKEGMSYLYTNAGVCMCPSIYEPFGLVMIESLSCGTPVVALGNNPDFIVAAPEIVIHPQHGKIVDENSPEKLAQAVIDVMNYPDKDKRRSFNIQYARTKYSWEKMVDDLLNIEW